MSSQIFITQTLEQFITSHLRSDEKYPISADQAEIIEHLVKDKLILYIQWPEEFSVDQNIYVWRYAAWKAEKENSDRIARMSHSTWVTQQIFLSNVDMIASALVEKGFGHEKSREAAWKWLRAGNKAAIKMVAGIEKLKENESEI